ncbi:MAG TPA: POTRA domain-containing protein [Steroidobacteraceae bacterium]|nr:POTRA domain-containing protein [Steroidobacteraceae bacterium]
MYRTRWLSGRGVERPARHSALAPLLALLLLPALARAADAPAVDAPTTIALPVGVPPPETPGIPPDAELEASKAVIGEILIDNQNIFNLDDPKDDIWLFRSANHLHPKTRAHVIRKQLLFKPGQPYSRRLIDESERILRANSYFYDAWIRPVKYHDGKVDVRVTTRDVWTLNPGFNYSRSGGTNSIGIQLEELNFLGTGTDVRLLHQTTVDRTESLVTLSHNHAFDGFTQAALTYANASDGWTHELTVNRPFYALDTRTAGGVSGLDNAQTDSLYDRGEIIDQFHDQHNALSAYAGWSPGLQNGWVHRFSAGATYDEHLFSPLATGTFLVPEDRRFIYPWLEYDLVQDDYIRLYNHDQILRTEDFYLGTLATARLGWADSSLGSSQSALIFQSTVGRGFRQDGSTLLLAGDFSGRLHNGELYNGVADASIRYYYEQSSKWLFFTTLVGTKGWRLDLDNQILLGGDNGLRGYPLRYQDGTARGLFTIEQRYFTDYFPFRLWRLGGAIFFDAGRTWGQPPLAQPSLGLLKDAGFGLRIGNARSGLGNVIHVDLAFPFETHGGTIRSVQFLVQTAQSF